MPTAAKTTRAAIYCRLSRNRTGEQSASTKRQEAQCRKLAEDKGWKVVAVEVDDDRSAYSGKPRPGYERLLDLIRSGSVDAVLAWAPDRLHRSLIDLEAFATLVTDQNVDVATVQSGRVDLATPAGRLQARMLGSVARFESEHRSARTRSAHEAIAAEGRWSGGPRPYGYQPEDGSLVVVESEAAVICEAARRVLAGESLHGICTDLNARGVPTAKGRQWRTPTLLRILTGPATIGRREYKGEDIGPAQWPAIIDKTTHGKLVRTLKARGKARGRVARVSLLAGIARCGLCGHDLQTQRRQNGRRVYVCPATTLGGCGGLSIVADPTDELVADTLLALIDGKAVADAMHDEDGDEGQDVNAELAAIDAELAELAADLGDGRITRAEWMAARKGYDARRAALVDLAEAAPKPDALAAYGHDADVLRESWPTLTLDQKQAVVKCVLPSVTIGPATRKGPGFDPSRVTLPAWNA